MKNLEKKSKTGYGKTMETKEVTENKKAGRVKLSDNDKQIRYDTVYLPRMEKRNAEITEGEKLKVLSFTEWTEKNMPSGETRNEIFVRLVKNRLAKFDKSVENLKALSTYPRTEVQNENILKIINSSVESLRVALSTIKTETPIIKNYEI
jgi:hypothetical protein